MVKKRKSGSENIETARESNCRRKQPKVVPAGRPQAGNPADIDEQLRTEVEELRRQVLELHEYKDQDARSIRGAEWLARLAEENPDPVLQVSLDGAVQYRNPASFALCRRWNPSDELMVPPAIHNLIKAAYGRAEVIRREMIVGERTYLVTVAPAPAPAKYVNIYAGEVTARKKAQQAQRESEKRLALALSGTRTGMYERNLPTGEILGTEQLGRLLGVRPTTMTTTTTTTLSQVYRYHDWAGRVHPEDWKRIETELHRCMTEQVPFEADYRVMQRDGGVRWVADRGVFQYDAGGRPTSIVGILMDVTERKQAEEVLKVKDSAIASSVNAIAMADLQGRLTYVNPAFLRLWGYDEEHEVLGRSVLDFWQEAQRAQEVVQAIQNGRGWVGELVAVRKDGAHRNLYLSTSTVRNDGGAPVCMMASFVDITERKQAEEKYRRIVETATEGIVMADAEARMIFVNDRWSEIFGYSAEEARQVTLLDLVFPEDRAQMAERWESRKRGGKENYEFRFRRKDGSPVWLLVGVAPRLDPEGRFLGTLVMVTDITQRKQAEEMLRAKEGELELILTRTPFLLTRCSRDLRYRYVSRAYAKMIGRTPDQVAGKPILEIMGEEGFETIRPHVEAVLRGERVEYDAPVHFQGVGSRFLRVAYVPDKDQQGQVIGWIASILDITERKQAEEALRESEERLKATLHSMRDEVWIVDAQGRVVLINEAVQEHLGVAPDRWEDIYTAIAELEILLPDGTPRPAEQAPLTRSLHGEVLMGVQEVIRNLATGELRWREVTSAPIRDQTGQIAGAVVVARDITDRRQAEEALRELTATLESKVAQRTAQLRRRAQQLQKLTLEMSEAEDRERKRLAAILHDDVQQIMAAAKFHLSVMRNRIKDDASLAALGEQIDQMLKEAVEKSRGLSHELSPAALSGDFAEALDQLARQMQAKHGLVVQVHATGQVPVQSDAVKGFLYRTAQELLFNAVKHAQTQEARIRVRRVGRCLALTVSDRGRGFDPQELREAAGFGLLSIRERIDLLGGRMKIRSAKGKGSTFFLVVPDGREVQE